jgi:hypothetical protein
MDVITGMRGWEIDKSEWEEDLGGGISQVLGAWIRSKFEVLFSPSGIRWVEEEERRGASLNRRKLEQRRGENLRLWTELREWPWSRC